MSVAGEEPSSAGGSLAAREDEDGMTMDADHGASDRMRGRSNRGYARFGAMIATSTVVMFGLMYLNTWSWDHVLFSETRLWMALIMGAAMTVIMLAFMLGMYASRALNGVIFASAAVVFGLSLWVVRSQALMDDVDWMRAMIPHHSIAILTSERARIDDPRVRELADEIIETQRREIAEMEALIADLEGGPTAPPEIDGR